MSTGPVNGSLCKGVKHCAVLDYFQCRFLPVALKLPPSLHLLSPALISTWPFVLNLHKTGVWPQIAWDTEMSSMEVYSGIFQWSPQEGNVLLPILIFMLCVPPGLLANKVLGGTFYNLNGTKITSALPIDKAYLINKIMFLCDSLLP